MSKTNIVFRDVSPVVQKLRDFLLGRKHTIANRYEPQLSKRTQPPPQIPDGVSHKQAQGDAETVMVDARKIRGERHAHNYYFTRDARREVEPPMDLSKKLLEASSEKGAPKQVTNVRPTPGPVFQWDKHYE